MCENKSILFLSTRGLWQRDKRLKKGLEQLDYDVYYPNSILVKLSLSSSKLRGLLMTSENQMIRSLVLLYWVIMDNILLFLIIMLNIKYINRCNFLYATNNSYYGVFTIKIFGIIFSTPVIYDPHGGKYYSYVYGRKICQEGSVPARLLYHLDKLATRSSDVYILGSNKQKHEFVDQFDIDINKICVIYTGADETRFDPNVVSEIDVDVLYWGTFISYHKVQNLVEAAALCPDNIQFVLAGKGKSSEAKSHRKQLIEWSKENSVDNIEFVGYLDQHKLNKYICATDIAAGYYSTNPKISHTISNKVGEAAYMGKCIVNVKTPAIQEVFTSEEDIFLCEPSSPQDLASTIQLAMESDIRKIGSAAKKTYDNKLSPVASAQRLEKKIESIYSTRYN